MIFLWCSLYVRLTSIEYIEYLQRLREGEYRLVLLVFVYSRFEHAKMLFVKNRKLDFAFTRFAIGFGWISSFSRMHYLPGTVYKILHESILEEYTCNKSECDICFASLQIRSIVCIYSLIDKKKVYIRFVYVSKQPLQSYTNMMKT